MTRPPNDAAFSSRTAIGLAVVAALSFVLAFVIGAWGDPLKPPRTLAPSSFSRSALGHHGLMTFLGRSGLAVRVRRSVFSTDAGPDSPLIVAEPLVSPFSAEAEVRAMWERAGQDRAALLLVLPKWNGLPDVAQRSLTGVSLRDKAPLSRLVAGLSEGEEGAGISVVRPAHGVTHVSCTTSWGETYDIELIEAQFIETPAEFGAIVACEGRTLVAIQPGDTGLTPSYVVSDPDLLNNHGLARADHARLVHDLLARGMHADGAVFDETVHGFALSTGPVYELLRPPLSLLLIQGFVMLGLLVWAGSSRFGSPVVTTGPTRDGKRVLIDNAAQLLRIGGHAVPSLRAYFEQSLRAVDAHYFFRSETPFSQVVIRLQGLSDARGLSIDLEELRRELRGHDTDGISADRVQAIAARIHEWRKEMTDGSRKHS